MKKHLITLILFASLVVAGCVYIVWDSIHRNTKTETKKNLPQITNYEIDTTRRDASEGASQKRGNGLTATGEGPANLEEAQEEVRLYALEHGLSPQYYPEYLVSRMINNPELEDFVLNYPLGSSDVNPSDISITRDISLANGSVPFFLQWDERWGYTTYGSDLMGLTGCGPTALSMVAVYLTGDNSLNPLAIAEYAMDNGYYDYETSSGTFWSLMSTGAEGLGLTVNEVPGEADSVINALETGHPIICIMGPGDFTTEGHFIVLSSYSDGYVVVNDPNSIVNSEQLWSVDTIISQANGMWEYSYYG